MNLGKAVDVLMVEKDLSGLDVREATGWAISYISAVRNGQADPQARLLDWARVLGIEPEELLRRAKEYPDPQRKAVA